MPDRRLLCTQPPNLALLTPRTRQRTGLSNWRAESVRIIDNPNGANCADIRLDELEALLQEKDLRDDSRSRSASANGFSGSTGLVMGYSDNVSLAHGSFDLGTTPNMSHFSSGPTLDDLAGVATLVGHNSNGYRNSDATPFVDFTHTHSDSPQSDFGMELMSPGWPRNLPPYPFLRHL